MKHRTGIDSIENYDFLHAFVEKVSAAGCRTFIVHARNAILKGLSPKENREVPPLKYEYVYRLKRDFPALEIVLNGGIATPDEKHPVDGVMLGRVAWHNPWALSDAAKTRAQVVEAMVQYLQRFPKSFSVRHVARHMIGLFHGHPHARLWRRMLSDPALLRQNRPAVLLEALDAVQSEGSRIAA